MAKKIPKVRTLLDIADELREVRAVKNEYAKLDEVLSKELKEKMEAENTNEAGVFYIRTDYSYVVTVPELALPLALKYDAVKIDTGKIQKIFGLDATLRGKSEEEFGFQRTPKKSLQSIKGAYKE